MAYKIHITASAEQDLDRFLRYYSRDSVQVAKFFALEFETQTANLSDFPESGRCFSDDIHQILMRRFPVWIYYKIRANEIAIFAIFHCSRSTEKLNDVIKTREQE